MASKGEPARARGLERARECARARHARVPVEACLRSALGCFVQVRVALAQLRGWVLLAALAPCQASDDHIVTRDVGEAGEQAALGEVHLERPAQLELDIQRADQLQRLAPQIRAGPDDRLQPRAQAQRPLAEALGERVEIARARVLGGQGERGAGACESARARGVRIRAGGFAKRRKPALGDLARLAEEHHVGGRQALGRVVDRRAGVLDRDQLDGRGRVPAQRAQAVFELPLTAVGAAHQTDGVTGACLAHPRRGPRARRGGCDEDSAA